jgi:hypothetical protein
MNIHAYIKVLVPLILIQLLACTAVFLIGDEFAVDPSDPIVEEHRKFIWLVTARFSCVASLLTLAALAIIVARLPHKLTMEKQVNTEM